MSVLGVWVQMRCQVLGNFILRPYKPVPRKNLVRPARGGRGKAVQARFAFSLIKFYLSEIRTSNKNQSRALLKLYKMAYHNVFELPILLNQDRFTISTPQKCSRGKRPGALKSRVRTFLKVCTERRQVGLIVCKRASF